MKRTKYIYILGILIFLIAFHALPGEILKNPGFEDDGDLNDIPDNWQIQRLAVVDNDFLNAFEGNVSIITSSYHGFIQNVPIFGGTRLGFSGFMRGDTGGELGALACEFRAAGIWRHYQRDYWELTSTYNLYTVSFLSPPDADFGNFIIQSMFNPEWVRADAFSLVDEFIHNPDFEILENDFPEDWLRIGSPLVDSSGQNAANGLVEVGCDNGNHLIQDLAVYAEKKYKLTGHVRSDDGFLTPEAIVLSFLDDKSNPAGEISIEFTAQAEYSVFETEFMPPHGAILMRISLKPAYSQHSRIWFDAMNLFAFAISPLSFSPNDDQLHDETSISILLGQDSLVSAEIQDQSDQTVRTLVPKQNRQKGVFSFTWDGYSDEDGISSPGIYTLKVDVTNELGEETFMTSPVVVSDFSPLEGWVKDLSDFFPRGIWMHLGGFYGEKVDYDSHLAQLKKAGFNTILSNWIPDERLQDLMNAADKEGFSIIAHTKYLDFLIEKYPDFYYETVNETEWRDMATTYIAQLASHPSLLGYYIRDEIRNEYWKPAYNAVNTLRGMDPGHPAFSSIQRISNIKAPFDALDTAVLLHHYYPAGYAKPISPDLFNPFCQDLENAYNAASEKNRPLWMILQGFSNELVYRLPTNEEMRCHVWLALAYGAKGILYFISQSTYAVQGAFTYEGDPFPILETMKDINHELEILSSLLLDLTPAANFSTAIPDHTVRCWKDSNESPYVFVVNKDCLSTKTPELVLDIMTINRICDVVTSEILSFYYEAGQTHVPINMAPGQGRLFRIETENHTPSVPRRIPREAIFSALSLPYVPLWNEYFAIKPPRITVEDALAGNVLLNGMLYDISVYQGVAYIASLDKGLHVVNVKRPWDPQFMETRTDLHYYNSVSANPSGVFCADSKGGVVVFSHDEEEKLEEIGTWWGHTGSPYSLALDENHAYLASDSRGMTILDITDPTSPVLMGRSEKMERARYVIPHGEIVYVLDEFQGILIEDVSTSVPVLLDIVPLSGPLSGAINGDIMAIACGRYGIKIFSLENPESPVLTGEVSLPITESLGFYRNEWIFAAAGTDGVALIHLDEEGVPAFVKFHQVLPGYYARALYSDNYGIYVLYPYAGLYILSGALVIDPEAGEGFHGFVMY